MSILLQKCRQVADIKPSILLNLHSGALHTIVNKQKYTCNYAFVFLLVGLYALSQTIWSSTAHLRATATTNVRSTVSNKSLTNSRETGEGKRDPSVPVPAGGPPRWPWLGVVVRPGLGVQGWEAGQTPEGVCGLPCLPHSHHWRGTAVTKT